MNTDYIRRELALHQDRILSLIDSTVAASAGPPEEVQPIVSHARWTMVRLLQAYQIFKHSQIFDPLIRSGNPAEIDMARKLKIDCIAAGEVFRSYTKEWSAVSTLSVWDRYLPAMLAMTTTLRAHIIHEGQAIEELLGKAKVDRRMAG